MEKRDFDDEALLGAIPEHIQFGVLMKATPSEEAGERIIYVEASKESRDVQGEIVLGKALKDSVEVFRKFGVVDMDHKSMPSVAAKNGIEFPEEWILGLPVDIKFVGDTTIVKAQLRRGDTPLARRANIVWDGLTKLNPPDRYYASVGGAVLGREVRIDPATHERVAVITKTRWNNLALSLNPVHPGLDPASTTPIGTFAKSLNGFVVAKSLTAGYGTDSASLTGGAALRVQSLDGGQVFNYWDFREKFSALFRKADPKTPTNLASVAQKHFGLDAETAVDYVAQFISDFKRGLAQKRS